MSKASEWARRDAQTESVRPKYECFASGYYDDGFISDEKEAGEIQTVGQVAPNGSLRLTGGTVRPGDACAFARWILETFGNPETFPAREPQP